MEGRTLFSVGWVPLSSDWEGDGDVSTSARRASGQVYMKYTLEDTLISGYS